MIPLAQPSGPSSDSSAARAVRRAAAAPLPVESEEAFAAALSTFALDARGLADLDEAEWHALAVRALGLRRFQRAMLWRRLLDEG